MLGNLRIGRNSELTLMATDIPVCAVLPNPNSLHCTVGQRWMNSSPALLFLNMARALVFFFTVWGVVTSFTLGTCQWNI
jgi:hypothetical protein